MKSRRSFISAISIATLLGIMLLLALAYEARIAERLARIDSKPMNPVPSRENFHSIVEITTHYLDTLANSNSRSSRDHSRIEHLVRGMSSSPRLNHSHNRLANALLIANEELENQLISSIRDYLDHYIDSKGSFRVELDSIDMHAVGASLWEMYVITGEHRYRDGAEHVARSLIDKYPRNSLGSLPYRIQYSDNLVVDDKGMICSFLVRYGLEAPDEDAYALGIKQMTDFLYYGIDASGLPFHGYDLGLGEGFGSNTWARGSGWLAMGLSETLSYLPENAPSRIEMERSLRNLIDALAPYQLDSGLWRWDVNNEWARIDTSGTAMIGYAIELAIREGFLPIEYAHISEKALTGILHWTNSDGVVDHALLGCRGIGHYPDQFGPSNSAQGPTTALFALYLQRHSLTKE